MLQSNSILEWFERGGPFCYLIIVLAVCAFGLGIASAVVLQVRLRVGKIMAFIASGIGLLVLLAGIVGRQVGLSMLDNALAVVPPDMVDEIAGTGMQEAAIPLRLALYLFLPSCLPAVVALVIAYRRAE